MDKCIAYVFGALMLTACATPFFISANFDRVTEDHRIIAILPFEMIYTGRTPTELSSQDILEIGLVESQAFQISFLNEILRSTKAGQKPLRIIVQDYRETLKKLEQNQLTIESSWNASSEKLSELLEVDAIVRARIEKNRLMSDLESYGIEMTVNIVNNITGTGIWPWIPYNVSTSKKIKASYSLINGEDGSVIWSIAIDREADWRKQANEIIDKTNRIAAKKFPYHQNGK